MFKGIFLSLLVLILFSNPIRAEEVINGLVPQKGVAHFVVEHKNKNIRYNFTIKFWNVGKMGGDAYSLATITTTCFPIKQSSVSNDVCPVETTTSEEFEFSGGPDGLIARNDGVGDSAELHEGRYFLLKYRTSTYQIPVVNTHIFDGWKPKVEATPEVKTEKNVKTFPWILASGVAVIVIAGILFLTRKRAVRS